MGVSEFFRTLQWVPTLQVAVMRICMASLLWPIIMLLTSGLPNVKSFFGMIVVWFIVLTIAMLVAIPVIGLVRAGVPFIGLLSLPAWLVVVGDPLVHLIWRFKPEWVPVEQFKLINAPVLAVFGADD